MASRTTPTYVARYAEILRAGTNERRREPCPSGGAGRSYGPPPVLARDVPAGNATVELRVGDAVKRSKVVPVEAHQRATVKFR